MNDKLQMFARSDIKEGLLKLPEAHQRVFKLMYGRKSGKRSVEDAEKLTVDEVVAEVPADKLDWAMQQVDNSLKKVAKEGQ